MVDRFEVTLIWHSIGKVVINGGMPYDTFVHFKSLITLVKMVKLCWLVLYVKLLGAGWQDNCDRYMY